MKLKTTKEASEQYYNVASSSENHLKLMMEEKEAAIKEAEKLKDKVRELEEKCGELEGELSIQMDDQDMANVSIKSKSHMLEEELSTKTMDLQTAREQLENARNENKALIDSLRASENKYAREVIFLKFFVLFLTFDLTDDVAFGRPTKTDRFKIRT